MKNYEQYKEKSNAWIIKLMLEKAFSNNSRYDYERFYSLTGGGIYNLVYDKKMNILYELDDKKKNKIPTHSKMNDEKKHCLFLEVVDILSFEFDEVYETPIGICIKDSNLGIYELKIIRKMKKPT